MIITSDELRLEYRRMWPLMLPLEAADRRYIPPKLRDVQWCFSRCERYRHMVFTDEIEDCDDFALQLYSEFKWNWARWKENDTIAPMEEITFRRKFKYPPAMGISFGIRFRGEDRKHTVVSSFTEDAGFHILDAVSRGLYQADGNNDIILRTWTI